MENRIDFLNRANKQGISVISWIELDDIHDVGEMHKGYCIMKNTKQIEDIIKQQGFEFEYIPFVERDFTKIYFDDDLGCYIFQLCVLYMLIENKNNCFPKFNEDSFPSLANPTIIENINEKIDRLIYLTTNN